MRADENPELSLPSPEDREPRGPGVNGDARRVDEASGTTPASHPVRALVPAGQFYLSLPLVLVARLEASTTIDVLDGAAAERSRLVPRPDEYYGYVVRYLHPTAYVFTMLFTKSFLRRGTRYRLGGDVNYFSPELNLLAAALEPANES